MSSLTSRVASLPWRDVERPALIMVWFAGVLLAAQSLVLYIGLGKLGADAHAYWATGQPGPLYDADPGGVDAYLYSPGFAEIISPLAALPWPVFLYVWIILEVAVFLWLLRPLGWRWAMPLTLCCAPEWTIGNIVPFLAAAAVLGATRPGWWSVVALTKPTMALGPVWFSARGEWARAVSSVAVTAGIVAVFVVLRPGPWADWLAFLLQSGAEQAGERDLLPRVALAVLIVVWAARRGFTWALALAMLVATPVNAGAASVTILCALPRLVQRGKTAPDNAGESTESIRGEPQPSGSEPAAVLGH